MNPASNRGTAHLDTTARPARDSLSPGPPGEDSLSPRPGTGERVRQRGFQGLPRQNAKSAKDNSPVAQIFNLPYRRIAFGRTPARVAVADYKSAIRQTASLRYSTA